MSERYNRQTLIQGWDQEAIGRSHVIIAGAGALGCAAGVSLAMAGVGRISIVDLDTIEISNLARQLLFREDSIGMPKAEVAAKALREINPEIRVDGLQKRIQEVPTSVFKSSNVILDGLDDFDARRWCNSVSISYSIPLVSGGIFGFLGNLQVIIPGETPCLECQPLLPAHRLQKACTPPGEKRKEKIEEEEKIPSVSSVALVVGGFMAQEALKIVLGTGEVLREFLFWDGVTQTFTRMPLSIRENCVVCSPKYRLQGVPFQGDGEETLVELRKRVSFTFATSDSPILMAGANQLPIEEDIKVSDILNTDDLVYVIDETLPTPLKLRILIS